MLASDNTSRMCGRCTRDHRYQLDAPTPYGDEFFETADFRAAFESRHIGRVFKVYRNHPRHLQMFGKALNQETLARWLGVTQVQVSRLENGKPERNTDALEAYAKKLHLPQRFLWFLLPGESWPSQQPTTDVIQSEPVDRREFMWMASGAILGVTNSFHPGLSVRAGQSDVDYLLHRTARLRRLDNYLGGRDTYNLYLSELSSTIGYTRNVNCGREVRSALVRIIAEQAQLTGWAAFDAGMHAEAKKHYTDSLSAAREAGDQALMGNALAFLAYQEVSTTGPNVSLAEASFTAAEAEATPKVRALLLERKAWTYAVAGDYQASVAALADAQAALRTESDRPEPDWVFWVDDNEIDIMTGRCMTELHRPTDAVASLDKALTRFDETHARDKALYMTFLANALIDNNDIERAAIVTTKSLDLAEGVGSVRPSARITDVMHRLRGFRELESVSRLFAENGKA